MTARRAHRTAAVDVKRSSLIATAVVAVGRPRRSAFLKFSDGRAGAPLQPSVKVSASDACISLRGPVSGKAKPRTARADRATAAEVANAAS